MTRAVLDTNVLVSALIQPFGNEAQAIHATLAGKLVPCYSKEILEEYAEVLARPKFAFARDEVDGLIQLLRTSGLHFEAQPRARLSPDPGDDAFIACALAAGAELLVTGNKRHFPAHCCGQTKVVSARELVALLHLPESL